MKIVMEAHEVFSVFQSSWYNLFYMTKLDKNACMLTSMSCLLLFTKIILSQYDNNGYIVLVRNSSSW